MHIFTIYCSFFFIHVCTIFRWISSKYCKQTFVLGVYLYEKTYKENDRKNFYCNFRFVCVSVRFHFFLNFFFTFLSSQRENFSFPTKHLAAKFLYELRGNICLNFKNMRKKNKIIQFLFL